MRKDVFHINNSICATCKYRFNCPANDFDTVFDDLTGYVVQCDIYDYLKGEKEAKK